MIYHEERIKTLKGLRDSFPGAKAGFQWFAGVSLIRDDFFLEYTKTKAAEAVKASNMNMWPLQHINWEEAVKTFQKKYVPIDFEGVIYWVKKPI